MDQFNQNLDGYYDVENQLPRYLRERAEEYFAAEQERKESIGSIEAHERHTKRMRAAFLDALGGLPEQRTALNVEITGTKAREGYTIEKVVYESLPGFHVTGNLYRPEGRGPFPAVLFPCGHSPSAKAAPVYQRACIDLVRNGFATLVIDPIGQGERVQSYDPETDEIRRQSIREHTYLGQSCLVSGVNLARYFVWDMVRALDYLESREDVDDRLGVAGNSGGGMQTGFLMLIDDRLDAAVPCCFVTSREEYMKTGQAQDGEQILHRAIERGLNYDDFLSAFAPKPTLIGAAQSDFLCIEGTRKSFDRVERIYELYDRSENVELAVADRTHGLTAPLREAMVNWFREHLRSVEPTFETSDPSVENEESLLCTDRGQVHADYPAETHVIDLLEVYIDEQYDDAGRSPAVDDYDAYAESLRETVIDRLGLERSRPALHSRRTGTEVEEDSGVRWESVFFYAEQDVLVSGILAVALDESETLPTIVLSNRGTDEFDELRDRVAAVARERGAALLFDPRGVGGVQARDVNTSQANGGEYLDYHGTEYKLGSDAIMMGESLFGMRVFDVLRAREYLSERFPGAEAFGLVGQGVGALHALYAATAEPRFRVIHAEESPSSFYDIATTRESDIDFRLHVHGVVGECDVPQLLPALEDRDLSLDGIHPERFT